MTTLNRAAPVARRRAGAGLLRSPLRRRQATVPAELRRPLRDRRRPRRHPQRRTRHRPLRRLDRRQPHETLGRGHDRLLLLGRQGHLRHPRLAIGRARRARNRPPSRRLLARVRPERQVRNPLPLDPHPPERPRRHPPSAAPRSNARLGTDDLRPRRAGAMVAARRGDTATTPTPRAS